MPVYIDPSRSTNGTGTFADPRNTWVGVTWTAGESYLQKRGTVWDGSVSRITIGATGSVGNEITLGAYGDESLPRPVLDGGGTRDIAIIATNHAYINVQDFEIRNYGRSGPYFGATGDNSDVERRINLRRLWIHDIGNNTGPVAATWWWGSHVTLEDSLIERIQDDGVWCDGRNATFRRVTIRDVSFSGGGLGDCVQFGGARCSGLLIEDCDWSRLNNNDKQVLVLFGSVETAATFTIRRNRFSGFASGAGLVTLDVLTDTSGGAVFEQNTVIGSRGLRWSDVDTKGRGVVARHNKFIGIGDAFTNNFQAFSSINGKCLNSTFVGWSRGAQVGGGEVKNCVFQDISDFDYDGSVSGNLTNNYWWRVGRHAPGQEGVNNTNADPRITPEGRPLTGSPLLTAGADLGYLRDIERKQSRRHIGAYGAARFVSA